MGFFLHLPEMTTSCRIAFGCVHVVVMILWAYLTWLVISNIWHILIRQEKWKTKPLLVFYFLAFMAIVIRDYELITFLSSDLPHPIPMQQAAKNGVGIIQSWMMFELAMRIK